MRNGPRVPLDLSEDSIINALHIPRRGVLCLSFSPIVCGFICIVNISFILRAIV